MKLGLYNSNELSNTEYHSTDGEIQFFSSSQLKDAIDDIELFYKKYISKEIDSSVSGDALDIGNYYHTALLEPEKLDAEYTVFPKVRRGKAWEDFQLANVGKTILNTKGLATAEVLVEATRNCTTAMDILSDPTGVSELSLGVEFMGMPTKVRADWISIEKGYLMDLKSTKGNVKNLKKIQETISGWNYDLSAALYMDCFNTYLIANNMRKIDTLYWVFASKDKGNCKVWEFNVNDPMMKLGRWKYRKAINLINEAAADGWSFKDEITKIEPLPWEMQLWEKGAEDNKKFTQKKNIQLKPKKEDLL